MAVQRLSQQLLAVITPRRNRFRQGSLFIRRQPITFHPRFTTRLGGTANLLHLRAMKDARCSGIKLPPVQTKLTNNQLPTTTYSIRKLEIMLQSQEARMQEAHSHWIIMLITLAGALVITIFIQQRQVHRRASSQNRWNWSKVTEWATAKKRLTTSSRRVF